MTENAIAVRQHLRLNRMFIDDEEAAVIGQPLIRKAKKIVTGDRKSEYGLEWGEKAVKMIAEYSGDTEATFAIQLMNIFYGGKRMVPKGDITEAQLEEATQWIEEPFAQQGLHFQAQCTFVADSVPPLSSFDNPMLDKLLKEFPRVKTPKPDVAFALKRESFSPEQEVLFKALKCSLTTDERTFHTFFVWELKSALRPIFEAQNQCMRSGPATVNCRRNFNLAVDEPDKSITEAAPAKSLAVADEKSFTFSLAIDSSEAKLYVNWALIELNQTPKWQMHRLDTYSFDRPLEVIALLKAINNILDWGCGQRKKELAKQANDLIAAKRDPAFERAGAPLSSKKRAADGTMKV